MRFTMSAKAALNCAIARSLVVGLCGWTAEAAEAASAAAAAAAKFPDPLIVGVALPKLGEVRAFVGVPVAIVTEVV
jgi:hypothetical protein